MYCVALSTVKQHAVCRGVAGILDIAAAVHRNRLQLFAALKCGICRNSGQRIRKSDFGQHLAVFKRAADDFGHRQSVIGCGNRHRGDQINPHALGDSIGIADLFIAQNRIHPEGINGHIVIHIVPCLQGISFRIRVGNAGSVGSAEPAAECTGPGRCGRNLQLILFAETNGFGSVGAVTGVVMNGISLRRVVSVEDGFAGFHKVSIGISSAVAFRAARQIIPCREIVAALGQSRKLSDSTALPPRPSSVTLCAVTVISAHSES